LFPPDEQPNAKTIAAIRTSTEMNLMIKTSDES
jgi:hypothetical protein